MFEEQKKCKPSLDELIEEYFDGDYKYEVNDFINYVKQLKMTPVWYATSAFNVKYKGKMVFRFNLHGGGQKLRNVFCINMYTTTIDNMDRDKIDDFLVGQPEDVINFFIKHIKYCRYCRGCAPGRSFMLNNNTLENICNLSLWIENPTTQQFEYLKKFIHLRREFINSFN